MRKYDIRRVLAENIRKNRKDMKITQEKFAKAAEISLSYLNDIESYRTWVSDKTLANIALALNKEPYQLLIPDEDLSGTGEDDGDLSLEFIVQSLNQRKKVMKKYVEASMDDLVTEILQRNGAKDRDLL
jgi:transcriptional regulator with XRE-family HTH domain